ncbi:hypothetical protein PHMEG_00036815 [Phytophthora megakarya]|uniref:Uncharacterized protein n=1 Tax=Phytophthora megakarya TaxID=4795 RepID=A0A225UMD5_9STRA|nr:hypothetical protein PHMEG_00036815 [Phytophthora megakarya]
MDASDRGLCAIWPEKQEFVQVEFDEEELKQIAEFHSGSVEEFSINIRELMSAAFAAIVWAKQWSRASGGEPMHVRFWIDNASAVCWANKRSSRNSFAQMVLRLLALFEVQHKFYASARHIAGSENIMADAGSRVWQSVELAKKFADMSCQSPSELKKTLEALGAMLRAGALADTSRTQYRRAWNQWERWCSFLGFNSWMDQSTIDANAAQLGAFAVFLWRYGMNRAGKGNTYSTICNKLCAIRWFHKHTAGYDPGVNAGHAILLRGIRRFTDPVVKQQPLSPDLLRVIYQNLDLRCSQDQLLWGGLLLAFFFLLRRSEYLFIGKKHHNYVLRLGDIIF